MKSDRLFVGISNFLVPEYIGSRRHFKTGRSFLGRLDLVQADLRQTRREAGSGNFVADGVVGITGQNAMDLGRRLDEYAEALMPLDQAFVHQLAERPPDRNRADVELIHELAQARKTASCS